MGLRIQFKSEQVFLLIRLVCWEQATVITHAVCIGTPAFSCKGPVVAQLRLLVSVALCPEGNEANR